jgi:hypothetical protein
VALLDLLAVTAAILTAGELRLKLDLNIWAADALPEEALSATVGPWVAVTSCARSSTVPAPTAGSPEEWSQSGALVVVPSLTDIAGPRIHMRPIAGLPLLHIEGPQADEAGGLDKRPFDIVGSLALLVLTAPLNCWSVRAIWLEDRGPVIYRQLRIGRDSQVFDCFKLRPIYVRSTSERTSTSWTCATAPIMTAHCSSWRGTRASRGPEGSSGDTPSTSCLSWIVLPRRHSPRPVNPN